MKAVLLESPKVIGIKEATKPVRKTEHALIQVKAVGICGSDIGAYLGTNPLVSYPRIIGHEIAGEIIEIDKNAQGLKKGDRVVVDPYLYCGHCYPCSLGRTNCCENLQVLGVHIDGGMKEYMTHPVNMLLRIPDSIEWKYAPLIEPVTIALHAVHRTKLSVGEYIAINGAGAIGLLTALCSTAYGAIPIIVDPVEERLAFAGDLGVKHTINPVTGDLIREISKKTDGKMAEVVVEASGANAAIRNALDMVSYAGRIALTGWPKKETSLPTDLMTKKELDVRGSRNSAGEFREAIELISTNKINARAILSKIVSLDEIPQMVKEQSEHPDRYLKVNGLL